MRLSHNILVLFFFGICNVQAQDFISSESDYVLGYYISRQGDTVNIEIRINSRTNHCLFFEFKDQNGIKKINADSVKCYHFKNNTYVTTSLNINGQQVYRFLKQIRKGQLSLYSYYHKGVDNFGGYESHHFFLQKKNEELQEITKENFRKKTVEYLNDNRGLSEKIKSREYKYEDILLVVEQYNQYSLMNSGEYVMNTKDTLIQYNIDKNIKKFSDPEYGLEIPLFMTISFFQFSEELGTIVNKIDGGMGHNFGAGLRLNINQRFDLRTGLHVWQTKFQPEYEFNITNLSGGTERIKLEEISTLTYTGIYLLFQRTWYHSFSAIGFNLAFTSEFEAEQLFYDEKGQLLAHYKDVKEPFISSKIVDQIDGVLMFGAHFRPIDNIIFKPIMSLSYGLMPIINTELVIENSSPHAFLFKAGIILEYSFGK